MKVVAVPREQYGSFYKGDSYIILSVSLLSVGDIHMQSYTEFTSAQEIFYSYAVSI
jgi:hypothetical protein